MRRRRYVLAQSSASSFDLYTPTEEHGALRDMLANFVKTKVDPQVDIGCCESNVKPPSFLRMWLYIALICVLGARA